MKKLLLASSLYLYGSLCLAQSNPADHVVPTPVTPVAHTPNLHIATPRQLFADLFEAVQTSNVLGDNKTFVDALPKALPQQIMADYESQKNKPDFNLKQFVEANFILPGSHADGFTSNIAAGVRKHIDTLWRVLQRQPDTLKNGSLLPLPHPYIVPGGRFREVYYWDSYFTMLGLQQSHQIGVIENMINNFAFLINRVGFIPNGNRSYYLSRSQPPFFAMMVQLLATEKGSKTLVHYLPQLEKEYAYWMRGAAGLKPKQAALTSVCMPGGEIMNRYYDMGDTPREESYLQDVTAAKQSAQSAAQFYRNVRSAAMSGWDFSSRWFGSNQQMSSIQTTSLVPIDLNCLIFNLEKTIAQAYQTKGNTAKAQAYLGKAAARKKAILKYCYNAKSHWFFDYNWQNRQQSPIKTLAGSFTLAFKIASYKQVPGMAMVIETEFLKPGGLVTTSNHTHQQWDAPNGWAPLQYITIQGLRNYPRLYLCGELAQQIAQRWVNLNIKVFKQTGKLLEKYNVEDTSLTAGGGEYPLQDGFGWTNGVLLKLMNDYGLNQSALNN